MYNPNYDLKKYIYYNKVFDYIDTPIFNDIKKLDVEIIKKFNESQLFLDIISKEFYETEQLWWVIGIFNDIIDPFDITQNVFKAPSLIDLHDLFLKYQGE